jgi:endonuclease/exonuclease/phosphatase family metal-dependent hydrolase
MKMMAAFVVVTLVLCGVARADDIEVDSAQPVRLRVMSYNIHLGIGMDGKLDLARTAKLIVSHKPDLVALQEVDNKTRRTGGVDQTAELAKLTGLHGQFGKAMDHDGGQYGEAVLSRWPILKAENFPLPGDLGYEPRAALMVRVGVHQVGPLWFVGTHLDHTRNAKQRRMQIDKLDEVLLRDDRLPAILAGDFNAEPSSDEMRRVFKHWTDAGPSHDQLTWPADKPRMRIDYILYRPQSRWRVLHAEVIDEPLVSDHRPVLVELEYSDNK